MKQKILDGLKQKYSNLGLSNEILEGQAEMLSSFATDDNLATLIEGQEKTLKAIQSTSDKDRGRLANLQKELDALKGEQQPQPKPTEPIEMPKDNELATALAAMQNMLNEFKTETQTKLSSFEKQTIEEKRKTDFQSTLKGLDSDFVDLFTAKFELNKGASDEEFQTFLNEHKTKVTNLIAKQESFIPSGGKRVVDETLQPTSKDMESIRDFKKQNGL